MFAYHRRRGWEIPEKQATSEEVFLARRRFMGASAALAGGVAVTAPTSAKAWLWGSSDTRPAWEVGATDTAAELYPIARNQAFTAGRALTPRKLAAEYNNFYEFGSSKNIWRESEKLRVKPWEVRIEGEVARPMLLDAEALIRRMPLEERIYRLRCVEAWAMTVPWTGFPLRALVALANPTSKAKYIRMETFNDAEMARGQRQSWYPWPYVEGLTLAEANNDLAFMVTGVYGKPLLKQHGAPLRLAVPWKYGFKSIKSIVRITFTAKRPRTFWEGVSSGLEYGFWANVNPRFPHPRWSQASERLLGVDERVPTQIYNGYGDYVADLYASTQTGKKKENIWR